MYIFMCITYENLLPLNRKHALITQEFAHKMKTATKT